MRVSGGEGAVIRSLKNGNLLCQRKHPDRASAYDRASWFFSFPCISPFLNDLGILNVSTVSYEVTAKNRHPLEKEELYLLTI